MDEADKMITEFERMIDSHRSMFERCSEDAVEDTYILTKQMKNIEIIIAAMGDDSHKRRLDAVRDKFEGMIESFSNECRCKSIYERR